eukprot:scaffold2048_cov204-Alexandrium_tamarense.AAC.43
MRRVMKQCALRLLHHIRGTIHTLQSTSSFLQTIPTTSNDDDAPVPQYIAGMHYEKSRETKRRNLYEAKISPIPETIDSRDEPMPKLYTSFAINDDREEDFRKRTCCKDAVILDLYSDEKSIKEHQSNESVHSSVYSPNAVKEKLAVASPVEYDEEPVYAAVECNPLSKPSLLKNRRCRVYSALALLLIGVVVAVVMVYSTKDSIDDEVVNNEVSIESHTS